MDLQDLSVHDSRIVDIEMQKEMRRAFMEYSMSVIVSGKTLP